MSITRRLSLPMLIILISAIGGLLVIIWAQARTAAQAYHERLEAETRAVEQILALTSAPLRSYAADYAHWDEMAQLTQTCDPAWADANIAATPAIFHADAAWVFRADGRLCYTTAPTITLSLRGMGLDAQPALGMERHGFFPLDTMLWELAAATIHPSDDSAGSTLPQGWFVVARRLDDPTLSDFATLLNSQVTLVGGQGDTLTAPVESERGQFTIVYPLRDLRGEPVATLAVVSAHLPLRKPGWATTEMLILVGTLNLVAFLLLSFELTRWVLLPLQILTHSLQTEQPALLDDLAQQRSEFGQLAGLVQAFSAQQQQLTHAIAAREQADATLRSFFDSAAVLMGVVELQDDDILHLSDNAATRCFFGLPPTQRYPYQASAAGVPREHIRLWLEHYHACAQQQAPVTFEYCHHGSDGSHWLAAMVSPITTADDTAPRFAYLVQDVTERKRTEAALREFEQHWQLALDATNDGLWDWDYVTGKVFFSDRWQAMLGFAPGEVIGHVRSWEQLVHPDDLPHVQEALQAHLDGRTPTYECEHRCRAKDGGWVWILDRGQVIARDAGGQPLRVVGTHTNVTARHLLEAELRVAEQRLRSMFERHHAIMLLVEPHSGAIVDANAAAAVFYGYPLAELRQMNIMAINQLDSEQVAAERARALAEQRNYFLFPHRLASGEIRMVEVHSTPITVGTQVLLFSIIHDITARIRAETALREREAAYRLLAENMYDVIWQLTPDLRCTYVSPSQERLLGYATEEVLGQCVLDYFAPTSAAAMRTETARRQQLIQQGIRLEPAQYEIEQQRKDGQTIWTEVISTPQYDTSGTLLGFQGVTRDISARKQMGIAEREQRTLAEALRDTAIALTSTLSVDAVLDRILEQVERVVPYDAVTILLVDADGDTVSVGRRCGAPEPGADDPGTHVSLALMPALSQMARTGQPVVLTTTLSDPSWGDTSIAGWIMSYAGAPIRLRQHTVGFLNVKSATPGFFTADHAERLQALANLAAIAIEHAQIYAEVEALAVADPLTGVANRRGLFQIGMREVERALRSHTPLALIMLDLDHFKQINDTYGHPMGDRVLHAIAACCRSIVRAIDVVARYGGEEFILLLPDTDLESAAVLAERLRQAVELMAVPAVVEQRIFSRAVFSRTIHVTASLGVVELTANVPTFEALIAQADRALYAAKCAGRNQIWCAVAGELVERIC